MHAQTESSSPVVFDVDNYDAVKHDTDLDQKNRTAKSQDLSKTGRSSLVQTTLSTLFKKVEEKVMQCSHIMCKLSYQLRTVNGQIRHNMKTA